MIEVVLKGNMIQLIRDRIQQEVDVNLRVDINMRIRLLIIEK
jgi:hypothetical protein